MGGSRQDFAHLVGVEPAEIVAFQDRFDTIAVALSEGNRSLVLDCSFEEYVADAVPRQVSLVLRQKGRSDSMAPVHRIDIERDYGSEGGILLGQDESHDLVSIHGDHAICRRQCEKIVQCRS